MCHVLKKKFITDKQLLYLWNMVIIPKLEYRLQIMTLDLDQCTKIVFPFQKFFKNKLNLTTTTPNTILENMLIYNFQDLFEIQKQLKITNFFIQINDKGLLDEIT